MTTGCGVLAGYLLAVRQARYLAMNDLASGAMAAIDRARRQAASQTQDLHRARRAQQLRAERLEAELEGEGQLREAAAREHAAAAQDLEAELGRLRAREGELELALEKARQEAQQVQEQLESEREKTAVLAKARQHAVKVSLFGFLGGPAGGRERGGWGMGRRGREVVGGRDEGKASRPRLRRALSVVFNVIRKHQHGRRSRVTGREQDPGPAAGCRV